MNFCEWNGPVPLLDGLVMGGRVEDWRGNPLGEPLSVSGVSSFVPV